MKLTGRVSRKYSLVPVTFIPKLGVKNEERLNNWEGYSMKVSGHEVLEKVLTIVGDYDIEPGFASIDIDSPYDFKPVSLHTADGKSITISIGFCDIDNPSTLSIIDDDVEDIYEVACYGGKLEVLPTKTKYLKTGFEQYYSNYCDSFSKLDGDIRTYIHVYRHPDKDKFHFIDENIKDLFYETKFDNIMDVYRFVVEKISPISGTYSVSTYNDRTWSQLEEIVVENNKVKKIELERVIKGNKVTISESFNYGYDSELEEGILKDIREIHATQKQLRLK